MLGQAFVKMEEKQVWPKNWSFFVTKNGGKTSTDKILTKKKFGIPNERN